ncbi:hypothetical protein ANO11243_018170 [Dothideomycetidae sp. 11243]|nr:hypothetical protein ANO11243_018170 [fungal sp. No.11243]
MDTSPASTLPDDRDMVAVVTSESARQREVFRGCDDATLAAFAQLGALRLNADRCMVILFGKEHEYLLAESTRTLSLQVDITHDIFDALWMGTASYPREQGLSNHVVYDWYKTSHRRSPNPRPNHYYTDGKSPYWCIISDLREHRGAYQGLLPKFNAHIRFLAAVPLLARSGRVIGTYVIFDTIPRYGISESEMVFLEDMAETVMDHLTAKREAMQKQRAERMVKGLAAFSQGESSLRGWWLQNYDMQKDRSRRQERIQDPEDMTREEQVNEEMGEVAISHRAKSRTRPFHTCEASSVNILPADVINKDFEADSVVPNGGASPGPIASRPSSFGLECATGSLFARASNLIREAMYADGVVFLDAGFAQATGSKRRKSNSQRSVSSLCGSSSNFDGGDSDQAEATDAAMASTTSSNDAADPNGPASPHSRRRRPTQASKSIARCAVLGYSTKVGSTLRGFKTPRRYQTLGQNDMGKLLKRFGDGELFNFSDDGSIDSSSGSEAAARTSKESAPSTSRRSKTRSHTASVLAALCDDARSIIFHPLWDSVRDKWRGGILVWSISVHRHFARVEDLSYLSAFVHSISGELVKLDTMASGQAKATFTSCISHELRSPLHGVLAGSECLLDTGLTQFQREMATTIKVAGSTLLETVNTILDFSKINSRVGSGLKPAGIPSFERADSTDSTIIHVTDLAILTENVVNTIVAGQRYRSNVRVSVFSDAAHSSVVFQREKVQVILHISKRASWRANVPSGTWARIVTSLVGNAVKYTKAGYVHVKLSSLGGKVSLAIQDTGKGISEEYQKRYMFSPFRQEDAHSAGTGLGLYIVKQLIHEIRGSIQIEGSREKNQGTKVLVDIAPDLIDTNATTQAPDDLESIPKLTRADGKPLELRMVAGSIGDHDSHLSGVRESALIMRDRMIRASIRCTCSEWLGTSFKLAREIDHDQDVDLWLMLEGDFLQRQKPWEASAERRDQPRILVLIEQLGLTQSRQQVEGEVGVHCTVDPPFGPSKLARVIAAAISVPKNPTGSETNWRGGNCRGPATSSDSLMRSTMTSPRRPTTLKSPSVPLRRADKKLLLVEDNDLNMRLLVAWARKLNLPFEQALNGLEAVQAYTADPTSFSLVLMDVSMPIMNGLTATREIRKYENEKQLRRCKVVALTGVASAEARQNAEAAGIDVFLTKPASLKLVRDLIEQS